jgi:hypothetical protein
VADTDTAAVALRTALEEASRLRRENATLQQTTRERTSQLFGEAGARISATDSAIDGQIASAEREHEAAKAERSRLLKESDFDGESAATDRMIDARTRIESLRAQKSQVALQRANLERTQAQDPVLTGGNQQQQADPLDGMNERERQWVAEHPSYLSDREFQQRAMGAASYATNTLRLSRDSAEYIDFINRTLSQQSAPAASIRTDIDDDANSGATGDVVVPRMPLPDVPRPVPQNPDDPAMQVATTMVDEMYPQTRAIGNGGQGIRSIAAPPTRTIRELSRQHARGGVIEPTQEELMTARILIPDILGAEGAAMSDEDKIRTYHAWYNAPSSQRKLRRWYGRDAA